MKRRADVRRLSLPLVLALLFGTPARAPRADDSPERFPFVLPWNDSSRGPTDVRSWFSGTAAPAGHDGPVVVRDGHLHTGSKRLRLLGVNLCFGANFPDHDDARAVAARMAKFGINAVRFHHMDNQTTPNGIWARDRKTLDPGQLDRLDFLFAELKRNGIYADINLHVSRDYPGRPRWEGMPSYFKGVDNFDAAMIALQKDYARDLLTHLNPYTKTRYSDDPAVAIVEINNENALTHEWFSGQLDEMPDDYGRPLAERWNAWLTKRYRDDDALRRAWGAQSYPLFSEMVSNGRFTRLLESWNIERHEGAEATANVIMVGRGRAALAIDVPRPAKQGWHVQLNQGSMQFREGMPYTLTFQARADRPRRLSVNVMQAHDPWRQLWSSDVRLTREFQTFKLVIQPSDSERFARLGFTGLGAEAGRVELTEVSLRPGGELGMEKGEVLGKLPWFKKRELSRRTPEAQRDWLRFLSAVETEYWTDMARFLKEELKVSAPLVGTQMTWSPPSVQARLDVIDSHAYWQHPHFPGRPWDPANWTVNNQPMAGRLDGGTLPALGLSRIEDKPFLCTEYNHSAPNTFAAETAPLIFAYAALQDWDGVFLFAYSHRGGRSWDTGHFGSFFDIDQHPTKMATLPAAAALFLRGDLPPEKPVVERVTADEFLDRLRTRGPWGMIGPDGKSFSTSRGTALAHTVARAIAPGPASPEPPEARSAASAANPSWKWTSQGRGGSVTVDTPRSKLVATTIVPGTFDLGPIRIETRPNRSSWAVVTLTALDGPDLTSPGRVLLAATGTAENTGMRWANSERTSVGRDWGHRPSLVEGIPIHLQWPVPPSRIQVWPLDERGLRRGPAIQATATAGGAQLSLGPEHQTLWYELVIAP